ncbi:MAG: CotH kinase family protein [Clostridia bacterium]|nr:CotH kinase family protein [Clostridia bacterium]
MRASKTLTIKIILIAAAVIAFVVPVAACKNSSKSTDPTATVCSVGTPAATPLETALATPLETAPATSVPTITSVPTQLPATVPVPAQDRTPTPPFQTPTPTPKPTPAPTPTPTPAPTPAPVLVIYPGLPELVITEVMSSNDKYSAPDGNCYDFVEIYNNSDHQIDLGFYFLSDKESDPQRFRLPAATLEAGRFFVIYCSGNELPSAGSGAFCEAPFKISSSGETVYLSDTEKIIDTVAVPGDLKKNESYERGPRGFVYTAVVTPGRQNEPGYTVELDPPEADVAPGAYSEPFTLRLSGTGTIYYTTDGTPPDTSSNKYSGPINVSWITSIRAICIDGGKRSEEASFFYLVGIEHTLPVVNVAIRPEYLTGPEGVLNHVDPEYEHVSQVTMIEGGSIVFSAPCGFKLHGNDSKLGEKQNFQLRFRSDYGLSTLKCAGLFADRDADEFNSLLLKGGSEDYIFCGFRDELCTTLVDGVTHLDVLACRPVILYLNGQYHGIYFLRERYDAFRFAQELGGVSKDSVNILRTFGFIDEGSNEAYYALLSYCSSHDMTTAEALAYVSGKIDIYSLIDWCVCRSYTGDGDITNVRFYMSEKADGKWRWCYFDLDWAFWHYRTDAIDMIVESGPNSTLLKALMRNPEFRDMFIRRYAELMGTILNEAAVLERIDRFVSIMEPEIAQNQERYGLTVESWYSRLEELRDYLRGGKRDLAVLFNIKNYFDLSGEQMAEFFGALGYDLSVLEDMPEVTFPPILAQ